MLNRLLGLICLLPAAAALALPPEPAADPGPPVMLVGGNLHVGDGQVVADGAIVLADGVIQWAGAASERPGQFDGRTVDISGHHVYPGFILAGSVLGLTEVEALRHTLDYKERGDLNPSVRSLVAYNTDSELIPVTRHNGVLLAQVAPQGGLVAGTSSIMALDGWNWQDAVFAADDGVHVSWPARKTGRFDFATSTFRREENKQYGAQRSAIETLFAEAASYHAMDNPPALNLKLAALGGLFDGRQRLHVRSADAEGLITALEFFAGAGVQHQVVHGDEDLLAAAPYMASHNIPMIITGIHRSPGADHMDIDLPFRAPALFMAAGVTVGLTYPGTMNARNLPFLAGTASAYGLNRETALSLITLNVARILGIEDRAGSLEQGKSATLFVSRGDALDMRGNQLTLAFIEGREVALEGMQEQLYQRYKARYAAQEE